MGALLDIYGYDKRIARELELVQESEKITSENKKAIVSFVNHCLSMGLSKPRVSLYLPRLRYIAVQLGKDYKAASKEDLEQFMAAVETNPKLAIETRNIYAITLKKFYKWLEGNGEELPEKLKWLRGRKSPKKVLPDQLLTLEEVYKLIEVATTLRDKAFIHCLYESGCRVGEIAGLRIKDVSFDKIGCSLVVHGKTGQRKIRLVAAVNHLSNWIEGHPWKQNGEASLWPRLAAKNRGTAMNYPDISKMLHKLVKKANIGRRIYPHLFRHSRATALAKAGLNETQLNAIFGWLHGSEMGGVYVTYSARDIDDAILRSYGLAAKQEENEKLKCPRCLKDNLVTARFCTDCGAPLSINAAVEIEDKRAEFERKVGWLMELLEKDEKLREIIVEKRLLANKK